MKRLWKPLVLAVALAAGAATGFVATDASAAACPQVCCPGGEFCAPCQPIPSGCLCPHIVCPPEES